MILIVACANLPKQRSEIKNNLSTPLSEQLMPFTSDGCSRWPEGTRKNPNQWLECCFKHDIQYWMGGTESQRFNADNELKACVKENFKDWMAIVMYMGVRVGGAAEYETSYKWGYGWTYKRGYLPLTSEEFKYAQSLAPKEGEAMSKYLEID